MSYRITAEVNITSEVNRGADTSKVKARILSQRDGSITFDVPGEYESERQSALVLDLCRELVEAGFVEFRIGHSF